MMNLISKEKIISNIVMLFFRSPFLVKHKLLPVAHPKILADSIIIPIHTVIHHIVITTLLTPTSLLQKQTSRMILVDQVIPVPGHL